MYLTIASKYVGEQMSNGNDMAIKQWNQNKNYRLGAHEFIHNVHQHSYSAQDIYRNNGKFPKEKYKYEGEKSYSNKESYRSSYPKNDYSYNRKWYVFNSHHFLLFFFNIFCIPQWIPSSKPNPVTALEPWIYHSRYFNVCKLIFSVIYGTVMHPSISCLLAKSRRGTSVSYYSCSILCNYSFASLIRSLSVESTTKMISCVFG